MTHATQRSHPRFLFRAPVRLCPPDGEALAGEARNLSRRGIFVAVESPPAVGTELTCEVAGQELRGRVAWVHAEIEPGVGIELADRSSDEPSLVGQLIGAEDAQGQPVNLWFEGLAAPIRCVGLVTHDGIELAATLGFLRVGSPVTVEPLGAGGRLRGRIDRIALADEGGVPRLAVKLVVDAAPVEVETAPVEVARVEAAPPAPGDETASEAPEGPEPDRSEPAAPAVAATEAVEREWSFPEVVVEMSAPPEEEAAPPEEEAAPSELPGDDPTERVEPRSAGRWRAAVLATTLIACAATASFVAWRRAGRPTGRIDAQRTSVASPAETAAPVAAMAPPAAGAAAPVAAVAPPAAVAAPVAAIAPPAAVAAPVAAVAPKAALRSPVAAVASAAEEAPADDELPVPADAPGSPAAAPAARATPSSPWRPAVSIAGARARLSVPVAGSTSGLSTFRLTDPPGVAIDLPSARPAVPLRAYPLHREGFRSLWVRERPQGGLQVRVHFAARTNVAVESEGGELRISVPR
jgi:hypothetical protein